MACVNQMRWNDDCVSPWKTGVDYTFRNGNIFLSFHYMELNVFGGKTSHCFKFHQVITKTKTVRELMTNEPHSC